MQLKRPEPVTHLFRGAPPVRSWSKYQKTVLDWTICGIKRQIQRKGRQAALGCTEDAGAVSCMFCRQLMEITPTRQGKSGQSSSRAARQFDSKGEK